jgi:hypothetical protein
MFCLVTVQLCHVSLSEMIACASFWMTVMCFQYEVKSHFHYFQVQLPEGTWMALVRYKHALGG